MVIWENLWQKVVWLGPVDLKRTLSALNTKKIRTFLLYVSFFLHKVGARLSSADLNGGRLCSAVIASAPCGQKRTKCLYYLSFVDSVGRQNLYYCFILPR